jgi:hypothetical protein
MLATVVMVLVALHIPSDAALHKTEKIATIYPRYMRMSENVAIITIAKL